MEKRIKLLESMWENKQVREKVADSTIFSAFTPQEFHEKFNFLSSANNLNTFTAVCKQAFRNIKEDTRTLGVHYKTEAKTFKFSNNTRNEDQMRLDAKVDAKDFFPTKSATSTGTEPESLGQLSILVSDTADTADTATGPRVSEAFSNEFTAYKFNGENGEIAFAQYQETNGVGVSCVMHLPDKLKPAHIWSEQKNRFVDMFVEQHPGAAGQRHDIEQIFDQLFESVKTFQGKYGNMSTFENSLKAALARYTSNDKFVKAFFAHYQTDYNDALKNSLTGLPCDDLLNLAFNQIDAFKQKHPHDPIIINSACSEEQVKAWMLAARIRNYQPGQIINDSNFKGISLHEGPFSNDVKKCRKYLAENAPRFNFKDHVAADRTIDQTFRPSR